MHFGHYAVDEVDWTGDRYVTIRVITFYVRGDNGEEEAGIDAGGAILGRGIGRQGCWRYDLLILRDGKRR